MKIPQYLQNIPNVIIFNHEIEDAYPDLSIQKNNGKLTVHLGKAMTKNMTFVFLSETEKDIMIHFPSEMSGNLTIIHLYSKTTIKNIEYWIENNAFISIKEVYLSNRALSVNIQKAVHLASRTNLMVDSGIFLDGSVNLVEDYCLDAFGSELQMNLLSIGSETDEQIVKQNIRHLAKNTVSHVQNSLVSSEKAKLEFDVQGFISKGMSGSVCKQQNRGVILSESGSIRVDPKLYIDEFDVDAGHGAAIGQINEEEMFYLLSRGLDELNAKRLIVSGYTDPFLANVEASTWKNNLKKKISRKIKGEDA